MQPCDLKDNAKTLKDNAKNLDDLVSKSPSSDNKGPNAPNRPPKGPGCGNSNHGGHKPCERSSDDSSTKAVLREAAERQIENLLPKNELELPPTIPAPTAPKSNAANSAKAAANGASNKTNSKKLI